MPGGQEADPNNKIYVLQVAKKLILLYLIEQPGCDHAQLACLPCITGHEVKVHRWVPQQHRDH